jgi:hypothetical protein
MDPAPVERRILTVDKLLIGALVILWRKRYEFAKGLAVPGLALAVLSAGTSQVGADLPRAAQWGLWFLYGILWTLFAIVCHRLVLLELRGRDVALFPAWTRRETVFVLRAALIGLASWAAMLLGVLIFGTVLVNAWNWIRPGRQGDLLFEFLLPYLSGFIATYLWARLSMVFPATAIDVKTSLRVAWAQTRANGLRMMLVVGGVPWILSWATSSIYRDEAGTFEALLVSGVATFFLALEVAALSLSYRELSAATASRAAPE